MRYQEELVAVSPRLAASLPSALHAVRAYHCHNSIKRVEKLISSTNVYACLYAEEISGLFIRLSVCMYNVDTYNS